MASERSVCTKKFNLNNGCEMPAVGLGTWQGASGSDDEKTLIESIVYALESGYRLLDTAQAYGSEPAVGKAIRASGIPRSEIVVVTKFIRNAQQDPAEFLRVSLRELGLDYVDVLLMHWPWGVSDGKPMGVDEFPTYIDTWKQMEKLVGPQCRSIGVSNFSQKTLDALLESATVVPAINQVELHALNPNLKLVPYCQSKGIHVMSWCTILGMSPERNIPLTHELFTGIAKAHDCPPAVVSLSWVVQRGITVIPKSATKSRIQSNIKLVTLSDEEMAKMNSAHVTIKKLRIADQDLPIEVIIDGKRTLMGWTNADFGWEDEQGNWLL